MAGLGLVRLAIKPSSRCCTWFALGRLSWCEVRLAAARGRSTRGWSKGGGIRAREDDLVVAHCDGGAVTWLARRVRELGGASSDAISRRIGAVDGEASSGYRCRPKL